MESEVESCSLWCSGYDGGKCCDVNTSVILLRLNSLHFSLIGGLGGKSRWDVEMGSREERHRHHHDLVPLAALISRELKNEKMEKPTVRCGSAAQSRKGEDYFLMKTDCQRVPGNPSTSFSVFGVCNPFILDQFNISVY